MIQQKKTQMQMRIDVQTKREVKKILNDIGMDASTAVNIFFKQMIRAKTFPIDLRDVNGFRFHKAVQLREAMEEASKQKKSFQTVRELKSDLMR